MSQSDLPSAPTRPPGVQPDEPTNRPPLSPSGNVDGHGQLQPPNFEPVPPLPMAKKSQRLLWIGLGGGFAAGVLASALVAGVGSALSAATKSHVIETAAGKCDSAGKEGISLGDKGASLTIDTKGEDDLSGASWDDATCVLQALKVPDSVVAQMNTTSALQGRQTAAWDEVEASWTYHPDSGVQLIITNADK